MLRARSIAAAYALVAALVAPAVLFAADGGNAPQQTQQQHAASPAPQPPAQSPAPSTSQDQPADQQVKPADSDSQEVRPATTPTARASAGSVTIKDFLFAPKTVTVSVGDTVTWNNSGPSAHTATGSGFDTGLLKKGQSGSHRFAKAGTFAYYCRPHPFMKGTIKVVAASTGGGGSGGGSTSGSSGGSSGGGGTNATAGAAGQGSSGSGSGSGLPATGLETGILAALGAALLGLGIVLRRRSA